MSLVSSAMCEKTQTRILDVGRGGCNATKACFRTSRYNNPCGFSGSTDDVKIVEGATETTGIDKRFYCSSCEKRFTRNSNLTRHMRIHEKIKRFQCKEKTCKKKVSAHSNNIENNRACLCAYQKKMLLMYSCCCHHCVRLFLQFTEKHHLQAHMRIHDGMRSFACTTCTRTFTDRSNCNRHIRTHVVRNESHENNDTRLVLQAATLSASLACKSSNAQPKVNIPTAIKSSLSSQEYIQPRQSVRIKKQISRVDMLTEWNSDDEQLPPLVDASMMQQQQEVKDAESVDKQCHNEINVQTTTSSVAPDASDLAASNAQLFSLLDAAEAMISPRNSCFSFSQ